MKMNIAFLCGMTAVSMTALADKPDFYDRACLAKQEPVIVQAKGGGYWYQQMPSPEECRTHGTYYRVDLYEGNPGNVARFSDYYLTKSAANTARDKLEREFGPWRKTYFDIRTDIVQIEY